MSSEKVCDKCPYDAAFDVGFEEISKACEIEELHRTERHKAAVGSITIGKELLSKLVSRIGCEGPIKVDGGYIVCPHSRTMYDARQFFEGPNTTLNFMYESVGEQSPKNTTLGQYL